MKNKLALLVLMLCAVHGMYGQAKVVRPLQQIINKLEEENEVFQPVSVLYNATSKVEEKMGVYTQLIVDPRKLQTAFLAGYKSIRLEIPQDGKPSVFVLLTQHNIHADDFELTTTDQFGKHRIAPAKGLFYYGVIEGRENSLAAISVFDNDINGTLSDQTGNYTLGKRRTMNGVYAFYNDREFKLPLQFSCGTPDDEPKGNANRTTAAPTNTLFNGRCARIFIDCGFPYYQQQGSSTTNVTNYTNSIFNVLSTIYANDSMAVTMSAMNIWTVNDGFNRTSTSTLLGSFRTYYASAGYNGSIASHWSTSVGGGGGLAYVDAICNTGFSFGVCGIDGSGIQNYPTYSWEGMVTSHECGHTLGSNHTHWCGWVGGPIDNCNTCWNIPPDSGPNGTCANGPAPPSTGGTVMSYCHGCSQGINLASGFGYQPRNKIRASIGNAACINVCNACNANLVLGGSQLTGENAAFWATNTITGNNITQQTASYMAFNAGASVTLTNFSVAGGATFIASAGCVATLKHRRALESSLLTKLAVAVNDMPPAHDFINISPNPFSNSLVIKIDLKEASRVSVRLYDMMGKLVDNMINNQQRLKGMVQLQYNNSKLAPATYLCVIELDGKRYTEKVVKMK